MSSGASAKESPESFELAFHCSRKPTICRNGRHEPGPSKPYQPALAKTLLCIDSGKVLKHITRHRAGRSNTRYVNEMLNLEPGAFRRLPATCTSIHDLPQCKAGAAGGTSHRAVTDVSTSTDVFRDPGAGLPLLWASLVRRRHLCVEHGGLLRRQHRQSFSPERFNIEVVLGAGEARPRRPAALASVENRSGSLARGHHDTHARTNVWSAESDALQVLRHAPLTRWCRKRRGRNGDNCDGTACIDLPGQQRAM